MSEKCPVFLLSYSPNSKNGFRRDPFLAVYGDVLQNASYFTNYHLKAVPYHCYGFLRTIIMPCLLMSLHRAELRTSSSSYVPAGGVETLSMAVLTAHHTHMR